MSTESVLIIAYNKPDLLQVTIMKILEYTRGQIYIHLDGPKNNKISVDLHNQCKSLIEKFSITNSNISLKIQPRNLGGQFGVLTAIDWFFSKEKFGIILEEDIECGKGLFQFTSKYRNYVMSGEFFSLCFFNPGMNSKEDFLLNHWIPWGWATSASNWQAISNKIRNPNIRVKASFIGNPAARSSVRIFLNSVIKKVETGEVSTWDAQVQAIHINQNLVSLFPSQSLTKHLGFIPQATHADLIDWWNHIEVSPFTDVDFQRISDANNKKFERLWRMSRMALCSNVFNRLKKIATSNRYSGVMKC